MPEPTMTDLALIPSPADLDLTWNDVLLLIEGKSNRTQQRVIIERFFVSEKVADCWIEGAKRYGRNP